MPLKQRFNIESNFSLASMTDVIFLLLIFFMITSTIVVPNAIQVLLPRAQQQAQAKPITRVTIDKDLNYYVANANERERQVSFEEITPFLHVYSAELIFLLHFMRTRVFLTERLCVSLILPTKISLKWY